MNVGVVNIFHETNLCWSNNLQCFSKHGVLVWKWRMGSKHLSASKCVGLALVFFRQVFFTKKRRKDILISRTHKRMYRKNYPLEPPKHNWRVSCAYFVTAKLRFWYWTFIPREQISLLLFLTCFCDNFWSPFIIILLLFSCQKE